MPNYLNDAAQYLSDKAMRVELQRRSEKVVEAMCDISRAAQYFRPQTTQIEKMLYDLFT